MKKIITIDKQDLIDLLVCLGTFTDISRIRSNKIKSKRLYKKLYKYL